MMKSKITTLLLSGTLFVFCTAAQKDCGAKKNNNSAANVVSNNAMSNNSKPVETASPSGNNDVKTLAEGSYGKIEQPFLFVVRSAETYRQLKTVVEDLPSATGIDYENQAIVAAFAGTRSTGGYSVEIKKSGEKVSLAVNNPPADAIVTEALTMPYQIAAVPVETENDLNLEISDDWKKAARVYKLSSGEFEYSGGIGGRMKRFSAEGTIEVWQFGDLATLKFNLTGANENKNMRLAETASGSVQNGEIVMARLDAGSFSEGPKPPLKVSGKISGGRLSLTFEPLPTNIRDGFAARGKLEAVLTK
ncbi:MAG TPA: protease complex subunit PrcB family protein [Pyrinomonadaceae bacterium]|jgi:hypothetical protein